MPSPADPYAAPSAELCPPTADDGRTPARWVLGTVVLATLTFVIDGLVVGQGGLALLAAIVALPAGLVFGLVQRSPRWVLLARAVIVVMAVAAVWASVGVNGWLAERRAARVITACEHYAATRGAYPSDLHQLVPEHLSSIPNARATLLFDGFKYHVNREGEPILSWMVVAPFGSRTYNFRTHQLQNVD